MATQSLRRSEAEDRRRLLEVASYDVDLDLTEATTGDLGRSGATFASRTTIRLRSGSGTTFLDVHPTALHRLRLDGADLPVQRLDRGRFPLDLSDGEHELVVEATMGLRTDGEGLHLAHDPADGRHYLYAMSFMDAGPSWFACFDQPDLKARYTVRVRTPHDWTVVGNGATSQDEPGSWRWGPTEPLSTYVVAMVAGPWHVVRDEHDGIALGLSVRASLADVLDRDADDLLTVTRQSLDDLHGRFGIRYPFGDYHQAFVPEFNAGAMENPACITLRDGYLSTSRLTRSDLIGRASTIAHEMAHQWFGNLVTPQWWDDLWLNESFAEYLGNRVVADSTRYADAWVDDVHARRQWGLLADQRPTTHPVAGNGADDAVQALESFDGISYAKGASVLRQLATSLGDEVFFGGVVDHLQRHRFANATLADLIGSWERAGARDLSSFVDAWLLTAGPDLLELDRASGELLRTPPPGHPADRTHTVGVAAHRDGAWRRETVTLAGARTAYDAGAAPLLVDPDCATWAVVVPDAGTVAALPDLLGAMDDPMLRASTWNSLRNAFHHARLDPHDALGLVVGALPLEDTEDGALHTLGWVYRQVLPMLADPDAGREQVHTAATARLEAAPAGSELQLAAFRCAVTTSTDGTRLASWSRGEDLPAGLALDVDLRWRLLRRLAEIGATDPAHLDACLDDDPSVDARIAHTRARASLPDPDAKQWAWDRFTGAATASNHEVLAAGAGLWRPGQEQVTDPFVDRYFDDLPATTQVRSGWTLADAAEAFFPALAVRRDTLERTTRLADDPDLDLALRRRLLDGADQLERMLAVRSAFG